MGRETTRERWVLGDTDIGRQSLALYEYQTKTQESAEAVTKKSAIEKRHPNLKFVQATIGMLPRKYGYVQQLSEHLGLTLGATMVTLFELGLSIVIHRAPSRKINNKR